MAVVNVWCGGTTSSTAVVVTKVDSGADVAVETDTDPGFSAPTSHGPVTPTADNVARVTVQGLASSTRYHYRVVHGGVPDGSFPGQFRTLPVDGSQASFTIGAASCSSGGAEPGIGDVLHPNGLSNYFVFDTIREQALAGDWPLFVHMGDYHYYDLGSGDHGIVGGGSLANYRRGYDDVLLQPRQHQLYRNVPTAYTYDDHDWGPNNSTGDIPDRANALTAYRERVPYADLAVPGTAEPNYFSIRIGRVLLVVLDTRSESDNTAVGDSPSKTMLGDAQKTWLANLLATTTAKALVLVSSRMWEHPTGADTWANYSFDRDDVIAILAQPGVDGQDWLSRMCLIQGDGHTAGIVDADHQSFGGFPVFQFAPMTSNPGGGQAWKNLGSFGNHGQFGTLSFTDAGDTITVTGTVWWAQAEGADATALVSHQFVINVEEPSEPPPTPTPSPPVARAEIQKRIVTWYGVNAVTGRIIAELPDLRGEVSRLLSAYQSAKLTMPIPLVGSPAHVPIPLVEQATAPEDTALVAVVNKLPTWMGWVLIRDGGTEADAELGCITPEGYLTRRRVRDHAFTQMDRAQVAAVLVGDAGPLAGIGSGFGFELDVQPTGDLIDRTYLASDRLFVYDALRELAADGLEFTVDLDWTDSTRTSVRKILRIGPRIGVSTGSVLFEATATSVVESQSGTEATYRLTEDHSTGKAANYVIAVAPGEGDDQPASAPAIDQVALTGGAPIVEHVFEVSSAAAINQGALDQLAQAELARLRRGAQVWQISARLDAYPRPGVDAQIGDDVSWSLKGHRHPAGIVGAGRMIGYVIDQQAGRWQPILLEPREAVVS